MTDTPKPVSPSPEETARWRRRFAAQANNRAWALADANDRTPAQDDEMRHAAHAAMHLWSLVGDASSHAHAHQLLAHVHALLGECERARHHLGRSQPFFLERDCAPWERGFAHLVAASVAAAGEELPRWREHHARALAEIADLEDSEERAILETSMRAVPTPPSEPSDDDRPAHHF